MFISIRRYSGVKPDAIEEIVRRIEAELLPQISAIPGFAAYYVLDESDGVLAAVSFFVNGPSSSGALSQIINVISPLPLFVVIGWIGYELWTDKLTAAASLHDAASPQPA